MFGISHIFAIKDTILIEDNTVIANNIMLLNNIHSINMTPHHTSLMTIIEITPPPIIMNNTVNRYTNNSWKVIMQYFFC